MDTSKSGPSQAQVSNKSGPSQHTPGPWTVRPNEDGGMTIVPVDKERWPNHWFVAQVDGQVRVDANTANARLIAAAPDLLAVLKALSLSVGEANALQHAGLKVPASVWADLYQVNNAAVGAIARAEGH